MSLVSFSFAWRHQRCCSPIFHKLPTSNQIHSETGKAGQMRTVEKCRSNHNCSQEGIRRDCVHTDRLSCSLTPSVLAPSDIQCPSLMAPSSYEYRGSTDEPLPLFNDDNDGTTTTSSLLHHRKSIADESPGLRWLTLSSKLFKSLKTLLSCCYSWVSYKKGWARPRRRRRSLRSLTWLSNSTYIPPIQLQTQSKSQSISVIVYLAHKLWPIWLPSFARWWDRLSGMFSSLQVQLWPSVMGIIRKAPPTSRSQKAGAAWLQTLHDSSAALVAAFIHLWHHVHPPPPPPQGVRSPSFSTGQCPSRSCIWAFPCTKTAYD